MRSEERDRRRRSRAPLDARALLTLTQRASVVVLESMAQGEGRLSSVPEVLAEVDDLVLATLSRIGRRTRMARAGDAGAAPSGEWILLVDAIDGLDAYRARLPTWATALALLRRGRPWLAAVVAPALRDTYVSSSGTLRWQGKVVSAAGKTGSRGLILGSGLQKRSILRLRRKTELQGSASYHGCLVARGAAEGAVLGRLTWRRAAIVETLLRPAQGELVFRKSGAPFELDSMSPDRRTRDVLVAAAAERAPAVLARLRS